LLIAHRPSSGLFDGFPAHGFIDLSRGNIFAAMPFPQLPAVCYLGEFLSPISLLMLMPIPQENVLNAKLTLRVYPTARFR
jgi:hypothetical protein